MAKDFDNPRDAWNHLLDQSAQVTAAAADGKVDFIDDETRQKTERAAAEAVARDTLGLLYKGRAEGTLSPVLLKAVTLFDEQLQAHNLMVLEVSERIAALPDIPAAERRKPFIDWRSNKQPDGPK